MTTWRVWCEEFGQTEDDAYEWTSGSALGAAIQEARKSYEIEEWEGPVVFSVRIVGKPDIFHYRITPRVQPVTFDWEAV
jgi:hypothetical protein